MLKQRKGISPLIAAVLLIAFTMAVASLFAQWAPQLIKQAQGDTLNESDQIQKCSQLRVEVAKASLNQEVGSITLQQVSGNEGIGDLSVTWFYDSGPVQNETTITSSRDTATVERDEVSGDEATSLNEIQIDPLDCKGAPSTTYQP